AEDGIRDGHVTGVQTCALPISLMVPLLVIGPPVSKAPGPSRLITPPLLEALMMLSVLAAATLTVPVKLFMLLNTSGAAPLAMMKIGRASCRERVEISVGGGP